MPKTKQVVIDFDITDVVYLRIRDDAMPGMVTSISLSGNGGICYYVSWANGHEGRHFACELTKIPRSLLTDGTSPLPEPA